MNPMQNPNQPNVLERLREYRILKCWVPTSTPNKDDLIPDGDNVPGFRYALQQRVIASVPKTEEKEDGTNGVVYVKAKVWNVVGEGSKRWAEINAEHYGIEVPEEEYIIEDHQGDEEIEYVEED